jgi:hypothetical protein
MNTNNSTVKQLLVERTYAEAAIAQAKNEQTAANEKLRNAQEYRRQIQGLIDRAQNATADRPDISDHALLNYIENQLGFNLDHIRGLASDDIAKAAVKSVVKDNVVLAIKP